MKTTTEATKDIQQAVIQRARELFFTHGYTKVLMAELAKQLGMSKKTLYLYFDGKEDLLQAVMKEYLAEGKRGVETILQDETLDFNDKISNIFSYVGTRLSAINNQFIADIKKNAPKSWQLLQDYKIEAAYMRFATLLEEGVRKGHVRKDINRPLAVILYASALETIFNPDFTKQVPHELMQEMPEKTASIFDGLVKIIFEGVLVHE